MASLTAEHFTPRQIREEFTIRDLQVIAHAWRVRERRWELERESREGR